MDRQAKKQGRAGNLDGQAAVAKDEAGGWTGQGIIVILGAQRDFGMAQKSITESAD